MTQAKERHVAVTKMQYMREHYLVLELFAGCARLTSMARSRDGWETMDPVDIIYGQDLHNAATRKQVLKSIQIMKPDLVTMSPRCGPWSQLQRINPNVDKVMEDRQADIPLWRFCREVWDEQDKHGRLALTENPFQSAALTMDFMMERPLHRAKVPQCAFGLKDVISGKPHQKYTAFDVNDEDMCEALLVNAVCNHIPEEHQPIEGNVYYRAGGKEDRRWHPSGQPSCASTSSKQPRRRGKSVMCMHRASSPSPESLEDLTMSCRWNLSLRLRAS